MSIADQPTDPEVARELPPLLLAPGSVFAYSGDDATSPRAAVLAGEVPILRPGTTPDGPPQAVLELRIHGVGGAPAEENLERPSTIQVAGDATAGFYRPWSPGSPLAYLGPRREAYCWGKLNYRAASRALWLLLIPFMLVNVAQWALPSPWRTGDTEARRGLRLTNSWCRAALRLMGLVLTVAFTATAVTVLGNLLAWQAPYTQALPSWLRWYGHWALGPRLAAALGVVLLAILGLYVASIRTASSYERFTAGADPDEDPRWPLTRPGFWNGARNVSRQRGCHVGAACAYVALIAALPGGSHDGARVLLLLLATAVLAVSALLIVSPWTDRRRITLANHFGPPDVLCAAVGIAGAVLATLTCLLRLWWVPERTTKTLPGDLAAQIVILWVEIGIVVVLAGLVAAQRPWHQPDVLGRGLAAPLFAGVAWLVSGVFGSAFTLTLANVLGSPKAALGTLSGITATTTLYVPLTTYAYGFGFLITVATGVGLLVVALAAASRRTRQLADTDVRAVYPLDGPDVTRSARTVVAGLWARARLTDFVAVALGSLTVLTGLAVVLYQSAASLQGGRHLPHALLIASTAGSTLALAATGYFLVQLRSAFVNPTVRKRIGAIWDVGTFWPRACHPFAPPCYAERSIPEVVHRVRNVVGDLVSTREPAPLSDWDARAAAALSEQHTPVLISGYSQGSPIAVAVAAQLPLSALERTALLTLAAPVRRLYGRTFPAYFGPGPLDVLLGRLGGAGRPRWINLVRRSDYIGGWVRHPIPPGAGAAGPIDREILDPPVLWLDSDPTAVPYHRHSDWFPDPQTRPAAATLMRDLMHPVAPVETSPPQQVTA
ncbi:MAG: hypothetical protein ABJA87_12415 [bacterium]